MKERKRCLTILAGVLAAFLLLSGCGEALKWGAWTGNGLAVEENGQVVYCVVDSFDKNIYDMNELTGMAVEEVALFNGKNRTGDSVPASVEEVAQIEGSDQLVRVVYRFDRPESYGGFQGEKLFYGSLEEAVSAKWIFEGAVLLNGEESIVLDEKNRAKLSQNHVIVAEAKTVIRPPYEVLWYSEGVVLLPDGSVTTEGCSDVAVLLLKK